MTKREFLDTVFALAPNEANAIMDAFDEYVESNVVPTGRSGKERRMTKYIIDIPDGFEWGVVTCRTEDGFYTRDFDFLEELNSDYINEHFGELQDGAYKQGYADAERIWRAPSSDNEFYQKGLEDGKKSTEKGCEGCKYESVKEGEPPCRACSKAYMNRYTPAPHSDRIEVGDEVNWDGDCFIVTKIFQPYNMKEQCDGIGDDGSVYHDILMEDLKKIGKHYDIASILEAMRNDR